MANLAKHKDLEVRMAELAVRIMDSADGMSSRVNRMLGKEWAEKLSGMVQELEDNYVRADTEGEVPTVAQGVALARFLRPHFNADKTHHSAFVSRGGAGLGENYLHVRFGDGYEGGIDKQGRTST